MPKKHTLKKIYKKYKNKSRSNKLRSNKSNKAKSRKYMKKGGAPWRLSVNSYTELQQYLDNNKSWINPDTRIWVVKNTNNNALYESNSRDIVESLHDHGITHQNISEYSFNIL